VIFIDSKTKFSGANLVAGSKSLYSSDIIQIGFYLDPSGIRTGSNHTITEILYFVSRISAEP
jgi:hypothetical protein